MSTPHFSRFGVTKTLPQGYRLVRRLNLENFNTILWLNLLGLLLLGLSGLGYMRIFSTMSDNPDGFNPLLGASPVGLAVAILVLMLVMLSVHELFHGIGFQIFGAHPRYGVNLSKGVAYASAKDYYLGRDAYLVVAMLPLVGVTTLSLILMALTRGELRAAIALIGAANIGGTVGDLWFVIECLRHPSDLLARDYGEGAELYAWSATESDSSQPA